MPKVISQLIFLGDTVLHSWEVLAKILVSEEAMGIVCDIGMHVSKLFRCVVICDHRV